MTAPLAQIVSGDYDNKAFDLRTYYAGFTRRALPEDAILRLSRASAHLPPEHIGYKVWLTMVAGTEHRPVFLLDVMDWAIGLADTIARMKPRIRFRSRTFCPSYDARWGHEAARDGVQLAVFGKAPEPWPKAKQMGCDYEAYVRIRNFVAGALLLAAEQYESELKVVFALERE